MCQVATVTESDTEAAPRGEGPNKSKEGEDQEFGGSSELKEWLAQASRVNKQLKGKNGQGELNEIEIREDLQ